MAGLLNLIFNPCLENNGVGSNDNKHRKGQRCLAERKFIHALIHEADINFNRST
jgi:hypothetical protein